MNDHRDASNRLTFDFDKIESDKYSVITGNVVSEFGLKPIGSKISGLDEIFQDFTAGAEIIGLEWDIWSGYIVKAKSKSAEPLARKIASYVASKFSS